MTWIYKNYKILLADKPDRLSGLSNNCMLDKPDFVRGINKLSVSVWKHCTNPRIIENERKYNFKTKANFTLSSFGF